MLDSTWMKALGFQQGFFSSIFPQLVLFQHTCMKDILNIYHLYFKGEKGPYKSHHQRGSPIITTELAVQTKVRQISSSSFNFSFSVLQLCLFYMTICIWMSLHKITSRNLTDFLREWVSLWWALVKALHYNQKSVSQKLQEAYWSNLKFLKRYISYLNQETDF